MEINFDSIKLVIPPDKSTSGKALLDMYKFVIVMICSSAKQLSMPDPLIKEMLKSELIDIINEGLDLMDMEEGEIN